MTLAVDIVDPPPQPPAPSAAADDNVEAAVTSMAPLAPPPVVLKMVVTDTGIGLSPAGLQRLFAPFQQARRRRGRAAGGILSLLL